MRKQHILSAHVSFETNISLDLPLYVLKSMYKYSSAIFRQKYNLHFQPFTDMHDGLNQHKCNICWKTFKTKYLCDRHIKSVHEKNETFNCDICGFKTYHQWSLTAHVQQVHQKIKPNKCDFCEEAFFYKRDKERHMSKAHA